MNGVLNLDKPAGMSSARAVDRVKRLLPRGTKIGHAGTLDPFATGVLLLLIGKATKLCERLMDQPKQYEATLKLGAATATNDPESEEVLTPGTADPGLAAIEAKLPRFTGQILQRPPVFSAMKVNGRRAYDLARKGSPPSLAARPVRIDALELLDYAWPFARLRIDCGRGTYIRALARDLGEHLSTGGYLTELRRTRVGPFHIRDSVPLTTLDASGLPNRLVELIPPISSET